MSVCVYTCTPLCMHIKYPFLFALLTVHLRWQKPNNRPEFPQQMYTVNHTHTHSFKRAQETNIFYVCLAMCGSLVYLLTLALCVYCILLPLCSSDPSHVNDKILVDVAKKRSKHFIDIGAKPHDEFRVNVFKCKLYVTKCYIV